jgi:membrane fusion protein, multidrug efflux system
MPNDPTSPSTGPGAQPPRPAERPSETSSIRPEAQSRPSLAGQAPGDPMAPPKPKARHVWGWIGAIVVVFIVLLGFEMWRSHEDKEKAAEAARRAAQQGTPITTTTAQQGNIGVYQEAIGTVTPVYTDSIVSQVNGLVTDVYYKEGQIVQKGDALIDIDSRPYRATLLQAQGLLERDQNVLAEAQLDLQRYKDALARKAIAEQIEADQEKLVLQDQGTVKNDQGTVQYDQVQVDFCHITSPIAGRVGLRLVDPGNVVQSSGNQTLAVITQMQPITVVFTIPEDSLAPVETRLHQHAKLEVDVFDRTAQTKITSGQLVAIDNQIDTTTGTVKGRAQFDNKDNELFPNEFVNTRLLVNTLAGVTLVASSAIQQNGSTSFVYVIQDNYAHLHNVKPGVTDSGVTQVDGINPGDVVANSGFDKLQDNAKVAVDNVALQGQSGSSATQNSSGNQSTKKGGKKNGSNSP